MIEINKNTKHITFHIWKIKLRIGYDFTKKIIKIFNNTISILDYILPKNSKKVLLNESPSGNAIAFYNYLLKEHKDEYKYVLIENGRNDYPSIKDLWNMYTAKYIILTHDNILSTFFKSKRHVYLNLYHGMAIKSLGFTKAEIKRYHKIRFGFLSNCYQFVTSDLFKHIMNNCFKSDFNKVYITGQPRTDMIWDKEKQSKAEKIFNFSKYNKVVFYLPTYKEGCNKKTNSQVSKEYNNIFYMDDYNQEEFIRTLEKENILFLMKPHPLDEKFYKKVQDSIPNSPNFKLIYNEALTNNGLNLYNLFNSIDLMISDFSSVTLDYLILNRPVIYLNNLSEDYSQHRGMTLCDNYEILMPGDKVKTYPELITSIIDNLNRDPQRSERERVLPLLHKYCDHKASERVYEIMKGL